MVAIKLTAACLMFGLSLLAGEAMVRFMDIGEGEPIAYRTHQGDRLFELDPEIGWRSKPHSRYRLISREYDITVENNSRGFRGPEPESVKGCRIALIGDSFVQGLTVNYSDTFGQVAQAQLGCTVIADGVEGYNTAQETRMFARDVAPYKPSVVILFFFYNDVWCNISNEGCGSYGSKAVIGFNGTVTPIPHRQHPGAWIAQHSRTAALLLNIFAPIARTSHSDIPLRSDFLVSPLPHGVRVFKRSLDPDIEQAWSVTESHLSTLAQQVQQTGARFLVYNIPTREQIDPEGWQAFLRMHWLNPDEWHVNAAEERLTAVCQRSKLDCMFPTARFQREPQPLYLRNDPHWNTAGHRLVGELVADAVRGFTR